MKRLKFLVLSLLTLTLFGITGCEKVEQSELTLDLSKTATIKVTYWADLDLTQLGYEKVPDGIKVLVTIPNSAFNPTASGHWSTTAETVDGSIEVTVPVVLNGANVTFTPEEFEYDQVQTPDNPSQTIKKHFALSSSHSLTAKPGQKYTRDIQYNNVTTVEGQDEMISRKFEIRAILEAGQPSEIITNKTITIYSPNNWSTTATTDDKGQLTVQLPKNKTCYFEFEAQKDIDSDPAVEDFKNYKYTKTFSSSSSSEAVTILDFGNGEIWE